MAWQDPRTTFGRPNVGAAPQTEVAFDAGLRAYMLKVYNYMASGVLLTGVVAMLFARGGDTSMAAQVLGAPPFFAPHRRVVVHGLASKPELNGLGANVLSSGMQIGSDGGARIPITMIGGPTGVLACPDRPQQLLLRPGNLRLVPFDGVIYEDEQRVASDCAF